MTGYRESIRLELARCGRVGMDPERVEEYMRLESGGCLDHLSRSKFRAEVRACAEVVAYEDTPEGKAEVAAMMLEIGGGR